MNYEELLAKALEAYLKSVEESHRDEYWDKVNKVIADEQNRSIECNKRFIPTPELMNQRFDI